MNPIVAVLPAGLIGWALGWLSAWATDLSQPSEDAAAIRGRSVLVRDPFVQGGLAVVWAAIPLVVNGDVLRWVEAGLLAVPMVQVTVTDFRTRYVYTLIAAVGLVLGLAFGWHFHGAVWWWSVVAAAGGALAFGALYGLGRLMYRGGEPLARGDITIAAMVGAEAATCAAQALLLGVLLGGVLALVVLAATRSRGAFMPYGPGLCLGGLVTLFVSC
jgi:prepilin signal peptidase PulO-like enzyme (type II secretory pathway)